MNSLIHLQSRLRDRLKLDKMNQLANIKDDQIIKAYPTDLNDNEAELMREQPELMTYLKKICADGG